MHDDHEAILADDDACEARKRAHPDYNPALGYVVPRWLCVDHAVEVTTEGGATACPVSGGTPRLVEASCGPDGKLTETGRRWDAARIRP